MARAENNVSGLVRYAVEKLGGFVWRNNVGFDFEKRLNYGLKVGSADWIGIMPITITPDMVGCRVGVFLSIETKAGTAPTDEQIRWLNATKERGGIAVIARRPEDVPIKWEFEKAPAS